ncbi:hypothetical protein NRIC_27790 [Enterococcus florum]|uniref:Mga helix-turn-helix domain-containing protein n=2 Tax=Enterococcus florum TaxID=2480627 RepID=A0A4P5PF79_9ENTE|nr:hypothetical protein NRIC_27790 [Enterococcus florum]
MRRMLLNDSEKKKMSVIDLLLTLEEGVYTIHFISQSVGYSFKTVHSLLLDMDREFYELFDYELLIGKQKINWQPIAYRHPLYQRFLFQKSLSYQFAIFLLTQPKADLATFSKQLFISHSSVRRGLRPLVNLLLQNGIKINLSKASLEGEERTIRRFLFALIWAGSRGEDLKKLLISFGHEEILLLQLSSSEIVINEEETLCHLLIARLRILAGHTIEACPLLENMPVSKQDAPLHAYFSNWFAEGEDYTNEIKFFFWLLMCTSCCLTTKDVRLPYLISYQNNLLEQENPLFLLCQEFISNFYSQNTGVRLTTDERELIRTNSFLTLLNFGFHQRTVPDSSELIDVKWKDQVFPTSLIEFLQTFLTNVSRRKNFFWVGRCMNNLVLHLAVLLEPYWIRPVKLLVGILSNPDPILSLQVKKLFDQLPFVEYQAASLDDEVDLLLSDRCVNVAVDCFPLTSEIYQLANQQQLLSLILQLQLEKAANGGL